MRLFGVAFFCVCILLGALHRAVFYVIAHHHATHPQRRPLHSTGIKNNTRAKRWDSWEMIRRIRALGR